MADERRTPLEALRRARGLSLRQLAAQVKIDYPSLCRYECGLRLSKAARDKLARFFVVGTEDL